MSGVGWPTRQGEGWGRGEFGLRGEMGDVFWSLAQYRMLTKMDSVRGVDALDRLITSVIQGENTGRGCHQIKISKFQNFASPGMARAIQYHIYNIFRGAKYWQFPPLRPRDDRYHRLVPARAETVLVCQAPPSAKGRVPVFRQKNQSLFRV
jgi:hypothetical protein